MDMRFVQKDNKTPPKMIAKESVYSFISCLGGLYLVEYFGFFSDVMPKAQTGAFLDEPNFWFTLVFTVVSPSWTTDFLRCSGYLSNLCFVFSTPRGEVGTSIFIFPS